MNISVYIYIFIYTLNNNVLIRTRHAVIKLTSEEKKNKIFVDVCNTST